MEKQLFLEWLFISSLLTSGAYPNMASSDLCVVYRFELCCETSINVKFQVNTDIEEALKSSKASNHLSVTDARNQIVGILNHTVRHYLFGPKGNQLLMMIASRLQT